MTKVIEFTCKECGGTDYYEPCQKRHYKNTGTFCSMKCLWAYRKKYPETWVRYKTGKTIRKGYVFLNRIRKLEHRLIIEKHIGRELKTSEHVHHVNGVKSDNRLENLRLLTDSEHHKLHAQEQTGGQSLEAKRKRMETRAAWSATHWSRNFDFCIDCGTNSIEFKGNGRCVKCHWKFYKKTYKRKPKTAACPVGEHLMENWTNALRQEI